MDEKTEADPKIAIDKYYHWNELLSTTYRCCDIETMGGKNIMHYYCWLHFYDIMQISVWVYIL